MQRLFRLRLVGMKLLEGQVYAGITSTAKDIQVTAPAVEEKYSGVGYGKDADKRFEMTVVGDGIGKQIGNYYTLLIDVDDPKEWGL